MSEGDTSGRRMVGGPAPGNVRALASRVLSEVASKSQGRDGFRPDLFRRLLDSVNDFSPGAQRQMAQTFLDAGIPNDQIIDTYLTAAAHELGDAWCEDRMSFADVTIGAARLQAMVRELSTAEPLSPEAPCVLLVVPEDAYHTLGASVLADQLRRLGVSVRLVLGVTPLTLSRLIQAHDFDAILISASVSEKLETLRELVKTVRRSLVPAPPICIGGTVLDQKQDARRLTGADHFTNDIHEALRLCGLTIRTPAAASPDTRA